MSPLILGPRIPRPPPPPPPPPPPRPGGGGRAGGPPPRGGGGGGGGRPPPPPPPLPRAGAGCGRRGCRRAPPGGGGVPRAQLPAGGVAGALPVLWGPGPAARPTPPHGRGHVRPPARGAAARPHSSRGAAGRRHRLTRPHRRCVPSLLALRAVHTHPAAPCSPSPSRSTTGSGHDHSLHPCAPAGSPGTHQLQHGAAPPGVVHHPKPREVTTASGAPCSPLQTMTRRCTNTPGGRRRPSPGPQSRHRFALTRGKSSPCAARCP